MVQWGLGLFIMQVAYIVSKSAQLLYFYSFGIALNKNMKCYDEIGNKQN